LRRLKDWDDQASWEEFFNLYWRLIYSVACQAGLSDEEAQDVVQETVQAVARKVNQFKVGAEHGSFRSWLLHLTRWRIADQLRKRPPPATHAPPSPDETSLTEPIERIPDPASLNLEAVWEHEWEQNLVDAALKKLKQTVDPRYYQLFDLHVLQHMPAHKVAQRLGVPSNRVYFAKYKISRLLKREVKRLETRFV
jgi:RNA polymerase sigma factor (sigma-70 family)